MSAKAGWALHAVRRRHDLLRRRRETRGGGPPPGPSAPPRRRRGLHPPSSKGPRAAYRWPAKGDGHRRQSQAVRPRAEVRRLRAILHGARRSGLQAQNREGRPHFEAWLRGKLAYLGWSTASAADRCCSNSTISRGVDRVSSAGRPGRCATSRDLRSKLDDTPAGVPRYRWPPSEHTPRTHKTHKAQQPVNSLNLHVTLVSPEIHWNTGNAGRSCLAAGAQLHLVEPLGFSLDDREVRRAGLDYWPRVQPKLWPDWAALESALPELGEPFLFSPRAPRDLWSVRFPERTVLVFGRGAAVAEPVDVRGNRTLRDPAPAARYSQPWQLSSSSSVVSAGA